MTREEFNARSFQAECEFLFRIKQFERQLDEKYEYKYSRRAIVKGFLNKDADVDAAFKKQQEAEKEAERRKGIENIRGEIEAKFFGARGQKGFDEILPPNESKPHLLPMKPLQQISLTHSTNIDETSDK